VFAQIKAEVRKRCPVILNFSTGTILDDVSEQATTIREVKPEIAALNMGTMNYSKYSAKRKSLRLRHDLPEHLREDPQAARRR
jgi:3-keto-5-aminohexanoate cleavage enzyme